MTAVKQQDIIRKRDVPTYTDNTILEINVLHPLCEAFSSTPYLQMSMGDNNKQISVIIAILVYCRTSHRYAATDDVFQLTNAVK